MRLILPPHPPRPQWDMFNDYQRVVAVCVSLVKNKGRKKKWSLKLPLPSGAELTRFWAVIQREDCSRARLDPMRTMGKTVSSEATCSTGFLLSFLFQRAAIERRSFVSHSAQQPLNRGADYHFSCPLSFQLRWKCNGLWFYPKVVFLFSWWVQAEQPWHGALPL